MLVQLEQGHSEPGLTHAWGQGSSSGTLHCHDRSSALCLLPWAQLPWTPCRQGPWGSQRLSSDCLTLQMLGFHRNSSP